MRTIEATTLIAEDRKLVLQLPSDVTPGEHRLASSGHDRSWPGISHESLT
jgi:hypothetical protein